MAEISPLPSADCGLAIDGAPLQAMLDLDHPRKGAAEAWAAEQIGEASDAFDRDRWRMCAAEGILGITVDRAFGGLGRSTTEALLTFEGLGLGSADTGFVFALAAHVFATQRLLEEAASEEQKRHWFGRFLDGSTIGAFAMTEPETGSDTASITTTALRRPDGTYVLRGTKTWVTLGPVCDAVIVFATTDPGLGRWGITAFIVETDRPGVVLGPVIEKMGLKSSPFNQIEFQDCVVTDADRIGPEGAGAGIFTAAVEAERAFLYAAQLGATERVLNQAMVRASTRQQFGEPIGNFQAVSHRIATMKLQHEMGRLLVYKAAALHDQGDSVTMAAALAKLQTSEMAVDNALDSIRIHGAEGYTTDAGVEVALRHAIGGLAYSGTSDIQRNVVARLLGVERPVRRTPGTSTASNSRPKGVTR